MKHCNYSMNYCRGLHAFHIRNSQYSNDPQNKVILLLFLKNKRVLAYNIKNSKKVQNLKTYKNFNIKKCPPPGSKIVIN